MPGGQPQNGVKIRGFQQLFADGFTGSAFKQHIVWHNHRRFARRVQNGVDMLDEVQLFVGAGRPEILAVVNQILFFLLAFFIGHGDGGFLAKGRIG